MSTKNCPYCGEAIISNAIYCRFCKSDLPNVAQTQPQSGTNWAAILLVLILFYWGGSWLWNQYSISNPDSNPETNFDSQIQPTYDFSSSGSSYNDDEAKYMAYVVSDWKCHHDRIGNMVFEGAVKNSSSTQTLIFVKIRATIYDKNGNTINTDTTYMDSDKLYPGSTSTFTAFVDDPKKQGEKCEAEIESARFDN